jgi:hypothetical protein
MAASIGTQQPWITFCSKGNNNSIIIIATSAITPTTTTGLYSESGRMRDRQECGEISCWATTFAGRCGEEHKRAMEFLHHSNGKSVSGQDTGVHQVLFFSWLLLILVTLSVPLLMIVPIEVRWSGNSAGNGTIIAGALVCLEGLSVDLSSLLPPY